MATIRTAIQLQDGLSPAIRGMNNALNIVISSFEQMQRASSNSVDTTSIQAARRELAGAEASFNQVEEGIKNASDNQKNFNNDLSRGQSSADGLASKIGNAVKAYLGFQAIKGIADISDEFVQTRARLDLINDGLQTTDQLQNTIFQSAQRARSSYTDTAKVVSKLGILAKDAFGSNDEAVAFAEQMNKQFKIGGASIEEQTAGMYQLTQAMASGKLQGDEFRSIRENAPLLAQAIAEYTGKSMGDLKDMSSQGEITADIIKKSLFSTADETEARFAKMPKTIGEMWISIKNQALMAFQPVLLKINELANNPNFGTMVANIVGGMATIANVTLGAINTIANVGAFFQSNWSIIEPIIWGIVAALVYYNGALLYNNILTGQGVIGKTAHAVATWIETAALIAMTYAQFGLNAALALCPISWIIIGIIMLIAIFYAVIGAMNKFAGTSLSATGIIVGAFAVAGAVIGNIIIALVNAIVDSLAIVYNFMASIAEFFANVFDDPVGSIIRLFSAMGDTILQILQGIASAIDTLFGSSLANSVSGWRDTLQGWTDDVAGEAKIKVERIDPNQFHMDRLNYNEAAQWGYDKGAGFESSVKNMFAMPDMNQATDPGFNYDDLFKNAKDTADNTGAMKDAMEITDEDLKYLRDIAEQDAINRFTTAEVKVDMTNHNNINSEVDLDGIINSLGEGVYEGLQTIAEGATYGV